jgi:MFS family permease
LLVYYRESAGTAVRTSALAVAVLMLFFFYTMNNLRMPVVTGFLSDRTEAQQRATVLSVLSQLRAVLAAAAAPVFGLIADHMGIPFVFLIGGVVLLAAGALLRLEEGAPDTEGAEGTHGEG